MLRKLQLTFCLMLFAVSSVFAYVVNPVENTTKLPEFAQSLVGDQALTTESFLELTPKKIREITGQKLSLKEVVGLKIAQKQIKKEMKRVQKGKSSSQSGPKSQLIALLLVILVGGLGIHRFYLGYTTIGIIQLLTLGGCGIWALIDLVRIVTGDLLPADGSAYDPEL